MDLPLDFDSAQTWTRIVKIGLAIGAVYAIAVIGLFLKGDFLGGAFLLVFGLAFSAVLRRARQVSMGAKGRDSHHRRHDERHRRGETICNGIERCPQPGAQVRRCAGTDDSPLYGVRPLSPSRVTLAPYRAGLRVSIAL